MTVDDSLPAEPSVLVVCAHPDDESFGLGAVLSSFAEGGSRIAVLCLTHGEASTLHGVGGELRSIRERELAAAAEVLGVDGVELLDYPDGDLGSTTAEQLARDVERAAQRAGASLLLCFDDGGITGHPDHQRATDAARFAARRLCVPVLAWAIPEAVAAALNDEFGTSFAGRPAAEIDLTITVERELQLKAIACHRSQSAENPVLWRRLDLLGRREHLRYL